LSRIAELEDLRMIVELKDLRRIAECYGLALWAYWQMNTCSVYERSRK
jgi:hypothetical protein